jgi:uncharacterized RDD family membrane protein YckC
MQSNLPDPANNAELFEGLLTRRVAAYIIDVAIIGLLVTAVSIVGAIVGFLTLGLGWLALIVVIPAVIVGYYATTLGSPRRATVGMQTMDLVLTPTNGQPLDGWMAFLHALLFWITIWVSWPVSLAIALFTPRRQMLHDLMMGTLMLRRSPMERHWAGVHGEHA